MTDLDQGTCEVCAESFEYRLYHCGFSNCAYAYCQSCGRLAILDEFGPVPSGVGFRSQRPIASTVEPFLILCECGGSFHGNSGPRCLSCNHSLSAMLAASYIESNAPGASAGWRWQRSWDGLYCIDIGCRAVRDNWLGSKAVI
jgi:hypothetical protein